VFVTVQIIISEPIDASATQYEFIAENGQTKSSEFHKEV